MEQEKIRRENVEVGRLGRLEPAFPRSSFSTPPEIQRALAVQTSIAFTGSRSRAEALRLVQEVHEEESPVAFCRLAVGAWRLKSSFSVGFPSAKPCPCPPQRQRRGVVVGTPPKDLPARCTRFTDECTDECADSPLQGFGVQAHKSLTGGRSAARRVILSFRSAHRRPRK